MQNRARDLSLFFRAKKCKFNETTLQSVARAKRWPKNMNNFFRSVFKVSLTEETKNWANRIVFLWVCITILRSRDSTQPCQSHSSHPFNLYANQFIHFTLAAPKRKRRHKQCETFLSLCQTVSYHVCTHFSFVRQYLPFRNGIHVQNYIKSHFNPSLSSHAMRDLVFFRQHILALPLHRVFWVKCC